MKANKNKKVCTPEDLGLTDEDLARLSSMFSPDDFVTDDDKEED